MKFFFAFLLLILQNSAAYAADVNSFREKIEMNFGTIIVDPTGDTVTLRPNGKLKSKKMSFFRGASTGGKLFAKGDANAAVEISFSSGNSLTGPGVPMRLENLKHNKGATPTFNRNGKINFKVGAQLTINPNQASGYYSGTYFVTIDYP